MEKKGILISFEGGEGGGKSTQILLLKNKLEKMKREVIVVREPGGTEISEQIREVVLGRKNKKMEVMTEVLLFQAARAQVYGQIIIPALEKGKIVLCDRTSDSSVVYQGIVRGIGEELIKDLNKISTQNNFPSLTLLLDVPVKIGLERRNGTDKVDRIDLEKQDFHERVREAYLKLAKESKNKRWVTIDASKNLKTVERKIWDEVEKRLF